MISGHAPSLIALTRHDLVAWSKFRRDPIYTRALQQKPSKETASCVRPVTLIQREINGITLFSHNLRLCIGIIRQESVPLQIRGVMPLSIKFAT
ncbi:hypothetical protein RB195_017314 [Necator americanus]|uniref:Uncharacterized protein n=1 Tax=Necator americanus TaxID=51031 RepID=A0ABR1C667_NECAM